VELIGIVTQLMLTELATVPQSFVFLLVPRAMLLGCVSKRTPL
jgi:hypothetical protein